MLRDCFGPCFRLMLRLPDSPPTGRTDVRREAERLLEEAGRLALRGREAATVETARRMVEAWMDETALGIAWEGRAAWLGNPLQRRWRTGRRGGDWFFDEIRRLSPHRAEDAELAEVALRCLGFGFRGHFYNDPNGLGLEHRALAERFGCTAVPLPFPTRSISAKGKPPVPACRASADGAFRRIAADLLGHMATSAEPGVYREPTSSRRECGTSRKR